MTKAVNSRETIAEVPPTSSSALNSPETVDSHWSEQIGEAAYCPNCGGVRLGAYCVACGQKQLTSRLKFGDLLKDLFSRMSNFEYGLLFTFLQLLIRPGGVARDYIQGKQRCYTNPLTYFFLGAALQLVSLWFSEGVLRQQIEESFSIQAAASSNANGEQPSQLKAIEDLFQKDPAEAIADVYISTIQQAYSYAALLFFCFPFGVLLKFLHRFSGEKFRLGETMVFALYVFGQMLVITAMLTPITVRLGTSYQSTMAIATYFILPQVAHTTFFKRSWRARVLTLLATGCSMLIFIMAIVGIFIASILFHVFWIKLNAS